MIRHDHHHPGYWIGVALVVALALLAFAAVGATATAGAVFEGRPAMAGAQAGLGAMAGPPQGGIGLQGSDGAGLSLRRPYVIEQQMAAVPPVACADLPPLATRQAGATPSAAEKPLCLPAARDERFERRIARLGLDPEQQERGRM